MCARLWRRSVFVALTISIMAATGCGNAVKNDWGVYVMFDGRPNLNDNQVYFSGRCVGEIKAKDYKGTTITRLLVTISPEYKDQFSDSWAFYADAGRLLAVRLQGGGTPLQNGDKLCGFSSKAAFNWFKFKTLLSDRTYKASKLAENLFKRFGYS